MAAAQTLHALSRQQSAPGAAKMYSVLHHAHPPSSQQSLASAAQAANCVIVSAPGVRSVLQAKRPLAPAPAPDKSAVLAANNSDVIRCKRKISFVAYGGPHVQPASVARRNARERNRVKQVNNGFATLRQHIPASVAAALTPTAAVAPGARGASKKLSKVETLRMAVEYIRSLQRMLDEYDTSVASATGLGGPLPGDDGSRYYATPSPDDRLHHRRLGADTSSSPTPSFSSEGSASGVSAASSYAQAALYHSENYENYEPTSPEDEELLDVISWWQQQ